MTIQDALNKAIEGGYHIDGSGGLEIFYIGANEEYSAWTRKDNDSSFRSCFKIRMVVDFLMKTSIMGSWMPIDFSVV